MQVAGITLPAPAVRDATQQFVEKLAKLDPTGAIDVAVISQEPLHARYLSVKTGELLAEIKPTAKSR